VPVAVARRLARDGAVKVLERDGVEVKRVAGVGRTIPAIVRTALEARDPTCVVPDCEIRTGLEIDHVIPFAHGGETRLDNLARLCRFHHAQKTHRGWRLAGSPGNWRWVRGQSVKGWPV
jgi:5-methylcytosine-specific restriction endonuclease McrA